MRLCLMQLIKIWQMPSLGRMMKSPSWLTWMLMLNKATLIRCRLLQLWRKLNRLWPMLKRRMQPLWQLNVRRQMPPLMRWPICRRKKWLDTSKILKMPGLSLVWMTWWRKPRRWILRMLKTRQQQQSMCYLTWHQMIRQRTSINWLMLKQWPMLNKLSLTQMQLI